MKQYIFYFICLCCVSSMQAQEKQVFPQLKAVIDSISENPHKYYVGVNYVYGADTGTFYLQDKHSGNEVATIFLHTTDSTECMQIYHLMDSIAQANIYMNKNMANSVANFYTGHFSRSTTLEDWQKDLAVEYVLMGFKYCYRFLDEPFAISFLSSSLYTPEIKQHIYDLYERPTYTQSEAEVLVQNRCNPICSVSDSTVYIVLKHKIDNSPFRTRSLTPEEKKQWEKIPSSMKRVNSDLPFLEFCEKINNEHIQNCIDSNANAIVDTDIKRLYFLLGDFAHNKVYELAPFIDTIRNTNYGKYLVEKGRELPNINRYLARLKYKDYPQEMIARYTHTIDSLNTILLPISEILYHNGFYSSEDWSVGYNAYLALQRMFKDLRYIGTQDAYCAMAPLLLIRNQVKDDGTGVFSIGVEFYDEIRNLFVNIPLPKCNNSARLALLYNDGCKEEIEQYISIIYQWMVDNEGRYEIKTD